MNTDPTAYLDMRIVKDFGGVKYGGQVKNYEVVETENGRRRLFFIRYDDGDEEHITLTDLFALLPKHQQAAGHRPQQPRVLGTKQFESRGNKNKHADDPLLHRWVMGLFLDGYQTGFVHHKIDKPNSDQYLVVWQDGATEILPQPAVREAIKTFQCNSRSDANPLVYERWLAKLPQNYKDMIGKSVAVPVSFDGTCFGVEACKGVKNVRNKYGTVTRIDVHQHKGEGEMKLMDNAEERALFFVLYDCGDRQHFTYDDLLEVLEDN